MNLETADEVATKDLKDRKGNEVASSPDDSNNHPTQRYSALLSVSASRRDPKPMSPSRSLAFLGGEDPWFQSQKLTEAGLG